MSMKESIKQALVDQRREKTAAQLAAQFKTTKNSITARIAELRSEGYTIYANKRTDDHGRSKTFYRHGKPTRNVVAAGLAAIGRDTLLA